MVVVVVVLARETDAQAKHASTGRGGEHGSACNAATPAEQAGRSEPCPHRW